MHAQKKIIGNKEKKEFETFFNISWHACHMFKLYCRLYEEDEDRIKLLANSAGQFWRDVQTMWMEHVLLDVCKLTDSGKGDLTVEHFISTYSGKFSIEDKKQIVVFKKLIAWLRKKAKPPRNKIIGHIDRKMAVKNKPLGGLSEREIRSGIQMHEQINLFYKKLEEFIQIVSSKIYGSDSKDYLKPLNPTGSDAEWIISILEKARTKGNTYNESRK